ncbi:hypothetical protein Ocin01_05994 [Orchesella cincta]|uniref:Uncharacterized protein n=1 Tax=Orchesella cincta TaxID=48709 RepID=A0A1D2N642_ORCCI|nr:hypothetical protein Ocin01_05994 [Orchesella cincta]
MSHLLEEDSDSNTRSSEIDENDCESVDTDSLHLEEMEEDEASGLALEMNPSERVIGGSIILQIDQTNGRNGVHESGNNSFRFLQTPFENLTQSNTNEGVPTSSILSSLPEDERGLQLHHTASASTSLSEAASDNMSTRAVMGDTPSVVNTVPGEDDIDNSSQASMADSDADRVRRIHNSIFRGLEHDLAELVRIREETIQFLENGTQNSNDANENSGFDDELTPSNPNEDEFSSNFDEINNNSDGSNTVLPSTEERPAPVIIRERLTFPTRERLRVGFDSKGRGNAETDKNPNTLTFDGYSYTPIAKFDNAPPAKPGKPYVEVGLMNCDEKAAAARKIFDKLQYGDPDDESACFVRRFWRETSTVMENTSQEDQLPVTVDAATLAQRSASLQATLEEAFGGLRLRLQQAQAEASANLQSIQRENNGEDGSNVGESANLETGENGNENSSENTPQNDPAATAAAQSLSYYQSWDEETSIMNNPLNYDIWNELEDSNDVGSTITARINLAERRANNNSGSAPSRSCLNRPPSSLVRTTTVAVGTDENSAHDGDLEDEVDDEISSYFHNQLANSMSLSSSRGRCEEHLNRSSSRDRDFSPGTREFFQDIGVSEQLGRDIFDMFNISEEDEEVPQLIRDNAGPEVNSQMPQPLYRRRRGANTEHGDELDDDDDDDEDNLQVDFPGMDSGSDGDEEDEDDGQPPVIPRVPLADMTSGSASSLFAPNMEDDCSTRVYFDESYLSFAHASRDTQEDEQEDDDTN